MLQALANTHEHRPGENPGNWCQEEFARQLLEEARELFDHSPDIPAIVGVRLKDGDEAADLLAAVLTAATPRESNPETIRDHARRVFSRDNAALGSALRDISVTSRKNFEPGGISATLLFSRGIHALLGHRVAHSLWNAGQRDTALALKTIFGRAFSTDIHPAARFGSGIWLDHGLGFVVGETAIIGDEACIWHGVTLGSTLKDNSSQRHPRLDKGVTIGADAILLGGITVGEGSVIAAASVVLTDIAPHTTVAGAPAKPRVRKADSFSGF